MKKFIITLIAFVVTTTAIIADCPPSYNAGDTSTPHRTVVILKRKEQDAERKKHRMPGMQTAPLECYYDGAKLYASSEVLVGSDICRVTITSAENESDYTSTMAELSSGIEIGACDSFEIEIVIEGVGIFVGSY